MGTHRTVTDTTTIKATNCAIGGRAQEWDDEDGAFLPKTIKESEFHNFIYGGGTETDWTGTTDYDGASYLSSAPTFEKALQVLSVSIEATTR